MVNLRERFSASRALWCAIAIPSLFLFALSSANCSSVDAKQEMGGGSSTTSVQSTTSGGEETTTTLGRSVAGSRLPPGPNTVYILGDSVTLGAQAQVPVSLSGWSVTFDSKESRRIDQGTDLLSAKPMPIARVLIVHLCTNWSGGDFKAAAKRLMNASKQVERVVWVTCYPWLPAVADANAVIQSLPSDYPNVVVADWASIATTPGFTYGDHLHLLVPGAEALAALFSSTVGPAPVPR